MIFIETPLFTKFIKDFLPDENYRLLQQTILIRPEVGDLIRAGGGLRKIRWNECTGKRQTRRITDNLLLGCAGRYDLHVTPVQKE